MTSTTDNSSTASDRRSPRRRAGTVAATAVLAAALLGCGGGGTSPEVAVSHDTAAVSSTSTTNAVAASTTPPSASSETDRRDHVALRGVSLVDQLDVYSSPGGDPIASLPAATAFGTPTVVGVVEQAPGWVHVLVPVRPNDLTGWVRSTDVRLEPVDAALRVDLASRTLRLFEGGLLVGEWPVAIGRPDRPTPTGQFFITDKIATGDASSVWGAHAFGISAYSDVLDDFIGGIGQIGVHGTNDPSSIGQDVSSGCIRLPNEVIDDLIDRLPLGTPVHIA
jgi:lipoprotein-anchoring transpeptidase ErfK/SrfK